MQVVAMPPLYQVISMGSTVLILYFGSKNVLNSGWAVWNIANVYDIFILLWKACGQVLEGGEAV